MNSNATNRENFVPYTVIDRQQQGIVLGTFEIPQNWRAESNVYWNYQHTALPAVFHSRVVSPDHSAMFEFLPMGNFSWTEPEMGFCARGQNAGGVVNLPPMPGVDALVQLVIPTFRGNCQNLRIIEAHAAPSAVSPDARRVAQNVFAEKIRVKIEYEENGRLFEEEFRCLHTVSQFPPVSDGWNATYFTHWSLTEMCCFRAERGRFETLRATFTKIQSSFQINPRWMEYFNRITQMLRQNSQQMANDSIQAGWEMLRINGEASRQFIAQGQAYLDRQQERINQSYNTPPPSSFDSGAGGSGYTAHEAFIDGVIREEEAIYNPANTANEKVSGHHDHIWTDQFGNVQATNDPNYDPNRGSNRNWTEARKKRIGD